MADRLVAELEPFAPTIRRIDNLDEVRHEDFDVLVTDMMRWLVRAGLGGRRRLPKGFLSVVTFSTSDDKHPSTADRWKGPDGREFWVTVTGGHLSQTVEAAPQENLPEPVLDLVEDVLLPHCFGHEAHEILEAFSRPQNGPAGHPMADFPKSEVLHPFVTAVGKTIAGWYPRSATSEGWVLPCDMLDPHKWVAAALRHWAIKYRQFPVAGGWWELDRWQTASEAQATAALRGFKDELAKASELYGAKIAAATEVLDDARTDASATLRRLVTDKGAPLQTAVGQALRTLGYTVTDVDQQEGPPADGAGKREDYRAVDPDDQECLPIIEVKGYDRGARAGDLSKLLRHAIRSTKARDPFSAMWWVVNHFRLQPPDDRPRVLANEEALVVEHADSDPPLVIIDSRDLFHVVRAVEDGTATSADVRSSLRSARGWWPGLVSRQ